MEQWSLVLLIVELLALALISIIGYTFKTMLSELKSDIQDLKKDFRNEINNIHERLDRHEERLYLVEGSIDRLKFAHKKQHNEEL